MATLTPDVARNLIQRSMTTGAPTSEFDKYGGYAAVKAMYNANGGTTSRDEISAEDKVKYANIIAATGVGDLQLLKETNTPLTEAGRAAMVANGVTTFDGAKLTELGIPFQQNTDEKLSSLSSQYGLLNTQYGTLNTSFLELQKQLAALKVKNASMTSLSSTTNSSGVVNAGASNTSGLGNTASDSAYTGASGTGAVYGPDGTAYPGPAAAIAAGVYNYTMFPPTSSGQPKGLITNAVSATDTKNLSGVTGNYFGGTNQNPDNPWVNLYPTKA